MKLKKREGSKIVINPEAKANIDAGLCGYCKKPKSEWNRRKDWRCCSIECSSKFELYHIIRSWQELRMKAFERDNYKCVKCGFQPTTTENINNWSNEKEIEENPYYKRRLIKFLTDEQGIRQMILINDSRLIGDHIVPISLGGNEWDINNVQTLCENCNKLKTASDMKNIALERKREVSQEVLKL